MLGVVFLLLASVLPALADWKTGYVEVNDKYDKVIFDKARAYTVFQVPLGTNIRQIMKPEIVDPTYVTLALDNVPCPKGKHCDYEKLNQQLVNFQLEDSTVTKVTDLTMAAYGDLFSQNGFNAVTSATQGYFATQPNEVAGVARFNKVDLSALSPLSYPPISAHGKNYTAGCVALTSEKAMLLSVFDETIDVISISDMSLTKQNMVPLDLYPTTKIACSDVTDPYWYTGGVKKNEDEKEVWAVQLWNSDGPVGSPVLTEMSGKIDILKVLEVDGPFLFAIFEGPALDDLLNVHLVTVVRFGIDDSSRALTFLDSAEYEADGRFAGHFFDTAALLFVVSEGGLVGRFAIDSAKSEMIPDGVMPLYFQDPVHTAGQESQVQVSSVQLIAADTVLVGSAWGGHLLRMDPSKFCPVGKSCSLMPETEEVIEQHVSPVLIVFLVLIGLLMVGLLAGFFYNIKVRERSGVNAIPGATKVQRLILKTDYDEL